MKNEQFKESKIGGLRLKTYTNVPMDNGEIADQALLDQFGREFTYEGDPTGRCGCANH